MKKLELAGWMKVSAIAAVGLMTAFIISSCGEKPTPGSEATTSAPVELMGAGATFPNPLYVKWMDAYTKANPGVKINYQSVGSGAGIKQLQEGTVDFGASDAPLNADETTGMKGGSVVHLPMVAGAVVLAYNLPGINSGLKLTPEVVADIFLGKIKKWNDKQITSLNPDMKLPDSEIGTVHRSDGSGTTYIFTSYLSAVSEEWKKAVGANKSPKWPEGIGIGGKGNDGVAGALKSTEGTIGYVELAYADQTKLTFATLKNKAGNFIVPTIKSTTAAIAGKVADLQKDIKTSIINSEDKDAYPIAGITYIMIYTDQKDATKGQALVNYLNWAIHDGEKMAAELLYAPLPAEVVKINEATLATITSGGKPIK